MPIQTWFKASLVLFCAMCGVVHAESGDDLVKVKLIADVASIEPGKPFNVGVNFKIAPAWHLYWINPGDSGEPPRVNFSLPPGFTVSELKFPVPERIALPGDIISYAYENEVTLVATITPPKDLKPGQTIPITAKASWLVCEKVCLPGEGESKIELPVSPKSTPANREFFDKIWFATTPDGWKPSKPLDLSSGRGTTSIHVPLMSGEDFEVFPYPLENAEVSIRRTGNVDENAEAVTIWVSVLPGQTVSAKTFNVLVVSRNGFHRFAYDVPVTIVSDGAGAPSPPGKQ